MNYTREDVDRILEASEKATPGMWEPGEGELDGGYLGVFPKGGVIVSPICRVSPLKGLEETDCYNAEFIAGAPILAEEVRRLRTKMGQLYISIMTCEHYGDGFDKVMMPRLLDIIGKDCS
jgi:hypothetical protein